MHDWTSAEALQAASERHQRQLRQHTGYPRSNGSSLSLLCECGLNCPNIALWEAHLTVLVEAVEQKQ